MSHSRTAQKAEVKATVRVRDGFACTECGMTQDEHRQRYNLPLDVHRTEPQSEYAPDACVAICRRCHGKKAKAPHNRIVRKQGKRFLVRFEFDGQRMRATSVVREIPDRRADALGVTTDELRTTAAE